MLRYATRIHPKLKLRRKLLNKIIALPEFNELRKIPTPTIPLATTGAPLFLQEAVWACRHSLDHMLIYLMRRTGIVRKNERLLRTFNLTKEYRKDYVIPNVKEWFSGEWIDPRHYINIIRKRSDLSYRPITNHDIAIPANISIMLDLIYKR